MDATTERTDTIATPSPVLESSAPQLRLAPLVFILDDLCQLLQTSTATLHRLKAAGKLPAPLRLGGQLRWDADEIREWVAAGMPDQKRWEAPGGARAELRRLRPAR